MAPYDELVVFRLAGLIEADQRPLSRLQAWAQMAFLASHPAVIEFYWRRYNSPKVHSHLLSRQALLGLETAPCSSEFVNIWQVMSAGGDELVIQFETTRLPAIQIVLPLDQVRQFLNATLEHVSLAAENEAVNHSLNAFLSSLPDTA